MTHGSLFSGIGGFDLAAEWAGWNNVFHCEINPFGSKVLKYYWPKAITYDNITTTDFTIHRGNIDILTGGFPCQPFSLAGKRKGTEDDRNLWPEYYRAIKEIQPAWVVGENVPGLINWSGGLVFEQVQADLENEGYEVWPVILPACSVNAPHKRERVWFVAYNNKCATRSPGESGSTQSNGSRNNDEPQQRREQTELNTGSHELLRDVANAEISGSEGKHEQRQGKRQFGGCNSEIITNTNSVRRRNENDRKRQRTEKRFKDSEANFWKNFPTQSPICSGNDGISYRLDGITFPKWRNESIKAYGNAIVPHVAYEIFKVINKMSL